MGEPAFLESDQEANSAGEKKRTAGPVHPAQPDKDRLVLRHARGTDPEEDDEDDDRAGREEDVEL